MARPRAIARLLRASNLPSVFSNCLTGAAVGAASLDNPGPGYPVAAAVADQGFVVGEGLLIGLGVMTFYLAGAILNDVFDIRWDREHRPDRPLASGLVSTPFATWFASVLIVVGVGWAWTMGAPAFAAAGALLAAVLAYDWLHKRSAGSVFLLGAARGLVITVAALAVNPDAGWTLAAPIALVVAIYTTLLSFIARGEYRAAPDARRWLSLAMPLVVIGAAAFVRPADPGDEAFAAAPALAGALAVGWLAWAARRAMASPPRTGRAVGMWLIGFCFVDAWCCALLGAPLAAAVAAGLGVVMLALQRLAPGT